MGIREPDLTGSHLVVIRCESHNATPRKILYGVIHIADNSDSFLWNVAFCVSWCDCKATRGAVLSAPSGFAEFTELAEAADLYNQLSYDAS